MPNTGNRKGEQISGDPAIGSSASLALSAVISIDSLPIYPSAIYVFDFDGVVASRFEDDIYKLSPAESESALISAVADFFGIRCQGMELRYQRHLVYQAAAWKLQLPIEPGPAINKTIEAGSTSPLFILTARSGWYAVERMRHFLQFHNINPTETFNIGRVTKDRQISLICSEFNNSNIVFVDDSIKHLQDAASCSFKNLELVWGGSERDLPQHEDLLRAHLINILTSALAISK